MAKWTLNGSKFATAISASGSPNPSKVSETVTHSAQVSVTPSQTPPQFVVPTGSVTFYDGSATLCSGALSNTGKASCTTSFSTKARTTSPRATAATRTSRQARARHMFQTVNGTTPRTAAKNLYAWPMP